MKTARQEIAKLNAIRLAIGCGYGALADEIGIPLKTLHRLLTDTSQRRCFDRTHEKVTAFLARFEMPARRRRPPASASGEVRS